MFTAREVSLALAISMLLMLVSIADAGCHRHKHKRYHPCKNCCPQDEEETTTPETTIPETTTPATIPTTSPTCDPVTCEERNHEDCHCWKKECLHAECPPPDDVPIVYKNQTCNQVTQGPNLICRADIRNCKCEPGFGANNGCLCFVT